MKFLQKEYFFHINIAWVLLIFFFKIPVQAQEFAAPVKIAQVEKRSSTSTLALIGSLEPKRRSLMAAGVEGYVQKIHFEEGDAISQGKLLITLDSRELNFQIQSLKSQIDLLTAQHKQAQSKLKRAELLFKRERLSEDEYQDAQYAEAFKSHEIAKNQANLKELEVTFEKTQIKAPFDGVVVTQMSEVGQWVNKNDSLLEIVDLTSVEAIFDLPERYIAQLNPKAEVTITVTAYPEKVFKGTLTSVIPDLDRAARSIKLKVTLDNPQYLLQGGMSVTAHLPLTAKSHHLYVPKDALIKRGPQAFVFLVIEETAQQVPVSIKEYFESGVMITAPLEEGQWVVVRGNERLREGQKVISEKLSNDS